MALVGRAVHREIRNDRPVKADSGSSESVRRSAFHPPGGRDPPQMELERRAVQGDAEAQYALTLFITDPVEGEKMLRRSAGSGYAPAVITLASSLMNFGQSSPDKAREARELLEGAARAGSYRAMLELEDCLEEARCGAADRQAALAWCVVSRILFDDKRVKTVRAD